MEYTITKNEAYNSVEIKFAEKPSESVRAALKALKFRWHSLKKVWYGYAAEDTARAAIEGKGTAQNAATHDEARSEPRKNKFGVKVGDIFSASWGYEQTNNNFFQVVSLVGESSVRVREVHPVCEDVSAVSGMSEDRVFSTNTNGELLPPVRKSIFIKDQERGDLKRLKSYDSDGVSNPEFSIASYASAYLCTGNTIKVYESWYY